MYLSLTPDRWSHTSGLLWFSLVGIACRSERRSSAHRHILPDVRRVSTFIVFENIPKLNESWEIDCGRRLSLRVHCLNSRAKADRSIGAAIILLIPRIVGQCVACLSVVRGRNVPTSRDRAAYFV